MELNILQKAALPLAALPIALGGVAALEAPASANCGAFGCTGNWTWSEFQALDGKWNKFSVEQLCICHGTVVTPDNGDGRKTLEYNSHQGAGYWVAIYYNKWADGDYHATAKEWGTPSGWTKYPL